MMVGEDTIVVSHGRNPRMVKKEYIEKMDAADSDEEEPPEITYYFSSRDNRRHPRADLTDPVAGSMHTSYKRSYASSPCSPLCPT